MEKNKNDILYQKDLESRIELLETKLQEAYEEHDKQLKKYAGVFHHLMRDVNDYIGKSINVIDYLGTYTEEAPLPPLEVRNYMNTIRHDLTSFKDRYNDKAFLHLKDIMKK